MKKLIKNAYPHALVVLGFVIVSLVYFYPVMQGKKIHQSDIAQYIGMAKEQNDFRDKHDAEPYWTNSAFGGMPTYQLGANYPHNYVKKIDRLIRFLPRPADYLFLYFIGFYILLCTLKIDPLKAFFGALAFGLSTYMIIILGVGHNAKAHAIAYMPIVVSGVLMVFQKKYWTGGLLTAVAVAFEISANHFQMTYYLLLLLLVIGLYYVTLYIKKNEYKPIVISLGVFSLAALLALGTNATNLMATSEYAKYSTRGKSELKLDPEGQVKVSDNGLSYDYITEYSYGVAESFNLIAPRLFGGSNREALGLDSNMYDYLLSQGAPHQQAIKILESLPTYWGDQPIVAAPAYIGAVVFFLALLALYIDKRKIKYAFVGGIVLSLLLSWGKNFAFLTDFFIYNVPLYNKFRAVSSIQVVLELCMPVLAIMGFQTYFNSDKKEQWNGLWKAGATTAGLLVFLLVIKSSFSFAGASDSYFVKAYGYGFVDALKEDRKSMYSSDIIRSLIMISMAAVVLWLLYKDKISKFVSTLLVGLILILDLGLIAKNYVAEDSFVQANLVDVPFHAQKHNKEILKDTTQYRVFDIEGGMSSARASYFHQSIGGYHAAKPRRIQQLFDYQVSKNNIEVLNMLNVKYIIQPDDQGNKMPGINPEANGNAWFITEIQLASNADEEMRSLGTLDSKKSAIINHKEFPDFTHKDNYTLDSLAVISLSSYEPNHLKYTSANLNKGLAVFSEVYYADGWQAYIDGVKTSHVRADYTLRALEVPSGKHLIEFKFEPQVVKTGSFISLISFITLLLSSFFVLYFEFLRKKIG